MKMSNIVGQQCLVGFGAAMFGGVWKSSVWWDSDLISDFQPTPMGSCFLYGNNGLGHP